MRKTHDTFTERKLTMEPKNTFTQQKRKIGKSQTISKKSDSKSPNYGKSDPNHNTDNFHVENKLNHITPVKKNKLGNLISGDKCLKAI